MRINNCRIIVIGLCLIFLATALRAQQGQSPNEPPPPESETFKEADGVALPWWRTRCSDVEYNGYNEPDCPPWVSSEPFHRVRIYNADGSEWETVSVFVNEDDFYRRKIGKDLEPFCCTGMTHMIILRMKAESEHWLEVEVNESTQATKFVRKAVKMWARASWALWLFHGHFMRVDLTRCRPRVSPGGPVDAKIEARYRSLGVTVSQAWVMKVEGEWAFVSFGSNPNDLKCTEICGWVRWKDGRDLLTGSLYNEMKIPELSAEKEY